jgi:NAD(P)-dependent dehydrogenase (short-subunit alcohol dehydrogenase family)
MKIDGKIAIVTGANSGIGLATEKTFIASVTPLGRTGRDFEVANVVSFLASDESAFVSGSEFFVDGGIAQI